MSDWFESESFWTTYAPIMYDDNLWEEAPTVADYIVKIAKLNKNAKVLDAACGVGRISVELAAIGMDVTGVDITKTVLETARESAKDEGVNINFIQQDLRTFCKKNYFDCAVNLFTSFGYCNTVEEDMLILKNIAASLKKDGMFIMECTSRETAIMYFTEGEEFERAGYKVITKFEPVNSWRGLKSKWILVSENGKQIEHEFIQRLYSAPDLCDKMIECGFSSAQAYGDFTMTPYDHHARTMIIIAKK